MLASSIGTSSGFCSPFIFLFGTLVTLGPSSYRCTTFPVSFLAVVRFSHVVGSVLSAEHCLPFLQISFALFNAHLA